MSCTFYLRFLSLGTNPAVDVTDYYLSASVNDADGNPVWHHVTVFPGQYFTLTNMPSGWYDLIVYTQCGAIQRFSVYPEICNHYLTYYYNFNKPVEIIGAQEINKVSPSVTIEVPGLDTTSVRGAISTKCYRNAAPVEYSWRESSSVTNVSIDNTKQYGTINIGDRNILFGGQRYNTLYVGQNGYLGFVSGNYGIPNASSILPTDGIVDGFIAAYWENISLDTSSKIYYFKTVTELVVTYENVILGYSADNIRITFQVVLPNGADYVLINYKNIETNDEQGTDGMAHGYGRSATIGFQLSDTSGVTVKSYDDHIYKFLTNESSIKIITSSVIEDSFEYDISYSKYFLVLTVKNPLLLTQYTYTVYSGMRNTCGTVYTYYYGFPFMVTNFTSAKYEVEPEIFAQCKAFAFSAIKSLLAIGTPI